MINNSTHLRTFDVRERILEISEILRDMPDGNLVCSHDGKYYRYFFNKNGKQYYISKGNRQFAVQLAGKKYLAALLKDMQNEMQMQEEYMKISTSNASESVKLLADEGIHALLKENEYFVRYRNSLISEQVVQWMSEDYPRNPMCPENLIHKGLSGIMLRSKSEEMIDMVLYQLGVPYRYECAVALGNHIVYPDFTLLHPISGDITYWEHFGMMDNEKYVADYHNKMTMYISNGIIPTVNMITTYETKEHPLTLDRINRVINDWLIR